MATEPRDRLRRERERVEQLADDGVITTEVRDRLLDYADALDETKARPSFYDTDGNRKTHAPRTIASYLRGLRLSLIEGHDLLDGTAESFNAFIDGLHDEGEKEKGTLVIYQVSAEKFYRYHDDLGVDPGAIEKYNPQSSPRHDETDMFTDEDVKALRKACGDTQNPVRNRAFLELLIFTGQRLSALLTLRIKDVDLDGDQAYIYLNDEYADTHHGLKGALQRGKKRPIFGARKYVRDWIEYHPQSDDPDAWLFVGNPSHWKTDLDDHWSRPSARQRLKQIAKEAGVDKPVNPHNFRHYTATILYREYDVDRNVIRMLFGHVEGSNALEETYSHLFEEDFIHKAEEALGYREKEDQSPLTPKRCPTCGELLEDHWRQCPNCQEVFAPDDLKERLGTIREYAMMEAMESMDEDEIKALKAIVDAIDDPEALADHLIRETQ